jgi:hypothetical protein
VVLRRQAAQFSYPLCRCLPQRRAIDTASLCASATSLDAVPLPSPTLSTENVAQVHTTVDEEEVAIAMNWQSGDSNNNGSDNSGSYENLEDELSYLL